ncbi:hypothetical protein WJX73_008729 [Symbiochloris irregularis]|uniref:NFACT RNA-binding domain-containing protein n=1 Tax=Symbiochloris irregularis TaxID=706552 RepID=A0AAW1PTK2_9CHLO
MSLSPARPLQSLRAVTILCWQQVWQSSVNTGFLLKWTRSSRQMHIHSEGFSLGEQVHAQLAGKVLTHAVLPLAWERVAELRFATRLSDDPSHRLYLEVMGRHSNMVVTGADRQIEACGRQVGASQSRVRQLQAGSRYELPPPNPRGLEPSSSESLEAWQSNVSGQAQDGKGIASGLARAYQGVSPALARELLEAAGASPAAETLTDHQWQGLHQHWHRWLDALATGSFTAVSDSSTGRMSVLGGSAMQTQGQQSSVHEMLDEQFRSQEEFSSFGQLQQRVSGALARALKRARGKAKGLADNLKTAEGSDAISRQAEMIMANLYRCKQGDDSVEAEDWDTGEKTIIALDSKKAPVKTAEALFSKARKQRRAVDHLGPLLQAANEELEYLNEIDSQLQMLNAREADDLQALRDIQDELVQSGHAKAPTDSAAAAKGAAKGRKAAKRAKGPEKGSGANPFRKFTSPGGLTVLVGRNNRQNDELSHKVAQPRDLWMHARGVPGAHTVMRIPSGREARDADVSFAADLAAWFSKARAEGKTLGQALHRTAQSSSYANTMVRTRRQRAEDTANNAAGFQDLPVEILQHIFSLIDNSEALAALFQFTNFQAQHFTIRRPPLALESCTPIAELQELHLDYNNGSIQVPNAAGFGAHIKVLTLRGSPPWAWIWLSAV